MLSIGIPYTASDFWCLIIDQAEIIVPAIGPLDPDEITVSCMYVLHPDNLDVPVPLSFPLILSGVPR